MSPTNISNSTFIALNLHQLIDSKAHNARNHTMPSEDMKRVFCHWTKIAHIFVIYLNYVYLLCFLTTHLCFQEIAKKKKITK